MALPEWLVKELYSPPPSHLKTVNIMKNVKAFKEQVEEMKQKHDDHLTALGAEPSVEGTTKADWVLNPAPQPVVTVDGKVVSGQKTLDDAVGSVFDANKVGLGKITVTPLGADGKPDHAKAQEIKGLTNVDFVESGSWPVIPSTAAKHFGVDYYTPKTMQSNWLSSHPGQAQHYYGSTAMPQGRRLVLDQKIHAIPPHSSQHPVHLPGGGEVYAVQGHVTLSTALIYPKEKYQSEDLQVTLEAAKVEDPVAVDPGQEHDADDVEAFARVLYGSDGPAEQALAKIFMSSPVFENYVRKRQMSVFTWLDKKFGILTRFGKKSVFHADNQHP